MDKAALVTGGATRLGREITLHLARAGYDIALHFHASATEAEETKHEVDRLGRACRLFPFDLADAENVPSLLPQVLKQFPVLSLLINNAARFQRAFLRETEADILRNMLDINLVAPLILSRDFARLIKHGQIINILDTKIAACEPAYTVYSLTKKALAELTRMSAVELGPDIRVNGICPGLVLPDTSPDDYRGMINKLPLRRAGDPDQVLRALDFLLESEYVTGETIFVDGGQHLG